MERIDAQHKKEILSVNWNLVNTSIIVLCIIITLLILGNHNYLLFHTFAELGAIVVAINITIIALNIYRNSYNNSLMMIGIAYGFIGIIDLLHTLSFNGMGIFPGNTANLSTQFWISARYIESISLVIGCYLLRKKAKISPYIIFYIYTITFILINLSIIRWGIFPDCFIPGQGLTDFKIVSEYIICTFLAIAMIILIYNRSYLSKKLLNLLILSLFFTILSELCFTLYILVDDIFNMTGHIFKIASFYFIYKSLCETGIDAPYRLLKEANIKLSEENILRKRTEYEIIKKEEMLKTIVDSIEEGILVVDNRGESIYSNKRFSQILRRPLDIFNSISLEERLKYFKNEVENYEVFRERILDTYKTNDNTLDTINFKDGRTYERYSCPFVIDKKQAGRLWSFRDITKEKEFQEKQREAQLREAQLIKDIEYDRLKIEFFSNLSHELKTPLNVILGTVQLSQLIVDKNVDGEAKNRISTKISIMKQNCYRLLRLINNIMDITKIDGGFFNINLEKHNIITIVEDITLSVADYIENKGINLIFDTDVEERIIDCDPDKIERVMLNLLSNAIKFTDEGGTIEVNIEDKGENIRISVKDNGTGIPEDKLDEIFDRFKQVDKTLVRNYQGTGIGLSLVKSLVEMHGGSITLESQYGQGSIFSIELPVVQLLENEEIEEVNIVNNEEKIERISIEFSDIYS